MEGGTMGRVTTEAKIENQTDLALVEEGVRQPSEVRSITVTDALFDTGATTLALPTRMIKALGLRKRFDRQVTTKKGKSTIAIYGAVRVVIQGRECFTHVMESQTTFRR